MTNQEPFSHPFQFENLPKEKQREFLEHFDSVLKTLTYREREIIKLRYGLGDGYTYTSEEVARIFKISPDDVRAIESRAVRKLQHPVRQRHIQEKWSALLGDPATLPAVLLQAVVVELGAKTDDGRLIEAVAAPWFEIIKLLKHDPDALYKIDPHKMEELIAGWYKAAGFDEVTLTPRSGDYGRDIIAVKHGVLCVRIIDQIKAYKRDHLVTAEEVRALSGVLHVDQKANKGLVTTTSDFAPRIKDDPSIQPLVPFRLELVNGAELIKRLIDTGMRSL